MSYFTFREASEITGLNEATIRRLSKKPESKPYIQMQKGRKGYVYTIEADYLFEVYPRLKFDKNPVYLRTGYGQYNDVLPAIHEVTALLAAKDDIIQHLKDETSYLQNENVTLRKEIHQLIASVDLNKRGQGFRNVKYWATKCWKSMTALIK